MSPAEIAAEKWLDGLLKELESYGKAKLGSVKEKEFTADPIFAALYHRTSPPRAQRVLRLADAMILLSSMHDDIVDLQVKDLEQLIGDAIQSAIFGSALGKGRELKYLFEHWHDFWTSSKKIAKAVEEEDVWEIVLEILPRLFVFATAKELGKSLRVLYDLRERYIAEALGAESPALLPQSSRTRHIRQKASRKKSG